MRILFRHSFLIGFAILVALVMTACVPGQVSVPTPTSTNTVFPTPTATPTLTPPPTETPTATAVVPPSELLAKLNLSPDRTYSVVDNYYVDSYNGAKLAKLDNGVWRETTLEEKYGHLVPVGERLQIMKYEGNFFHDEKGISDDQDSRYKNISMFVHSSGNITLSYEYNEGLGMNVGVIEGDVLYRKANGVLKIQNIRFDVIDPATPVKRMLNCPFSRGANCIFYSGLPKVKSEEEERSIYNEPGKLLYLTFAYERPSYPPKLHSEFWYPNTRNVANYYSWSADKAEYAAFADSLVNSSEFVPSDTFVLAAQDVYVDQP